MQVKVAEQSATSSGRDCRKSLCTANGGCPKTSRVFGPRNAYFSGFAREVSPKTRRLLDQILILERGRAEVTSPVCGEVWVAGDLRS